jgi:hypothetical protein
MCWGLRMGEKEDEKEERVVKQTKKRWREG